MVHLNPNQTRGSSTSNQVLSPPSNLLSHSDENQVI